MMTRKKIFFMLILISAALISPAQSFITRHYTTMSGLPTSSVYSVVQDSEGCIWMATENGVSRYDGVSWTNYSEESGLPAMPFIRIAASKNDHIWALSSPEPDGLILAHFDGKQWQTVNPLRRNDYRSDYITAFLLMESTDKSPCILVGTAREGVFRWENGSWRQYTRVEGLPDNRVSGMILLNNACYIATGNGLAIMDEKGQLDVLSLKDIHLPSLLITGIGVIYKDKYPDYRLKEDRICLIGSNWLGFIENHRFTKEADFPAPIFAGDSGPFSIQPDYRRGLFLADRNFNYYYDLRDRKLSSLDQKHGLVEVGALSQFIDFEKNIWIPCNRGVTKIASRHFMSYTSLHGLLEDEVSAILETRRGEFVFGHNKGYSILRNGEISAYPFTQPEYPVRPSHRVMDIKQDSQGDIWMAISDGGVLKRSPTGKMTRYSNEQGVTGYISTLYIDASDNLWAGGNSGVFLRKGERFELVLIGDNAPFPVHRIAGDDGGLRCIASAGKGVFLREPEGWTNYQLHGRSRVNYLYSIFRQPDDSWLLGTLDGLYILRQGKVSFFREKNFQLKRPVYFILKSSDHVFWFGADNGVFRWDGATAVRYSAQDGLSGIEANRAAAVEDSLGRLWFGSNSGVSVYFKEMDSRFTWNPPPKVRLLSIQAGDRMFTSEEPLELNYSMRNLIFTFRGVSFTDETQLRVKYKLDGMDEYWSEEMITVRNFARYPNVSPGLTRFHFMVRNAGGAWSQEVISPAIVILKPFYLRSWFLGLALLFLVMMLYGIARYFTHRRNAALLEKMASERTRQYLASEQRYRELFEESHDIIFVLSRNGEFLDINPAGLSLLGFSSREELADNRIKDLFNFITKEKESFWSDMQENGFVKDFELMLKRSNGELVTLLLTATALRNEHGKVNAIRGIARDISVTRKLQQQLIQAQKMEAIGTLAGGIAHDFNNILGVITGYADLTIDELPDGGRLKNNIEQVKVAAMRGKEMVNQILVFSRENSLERSPLKIAPIIMETLKFLRSSLPMTVELRQAIHAESAVINSNPTNIHQVLMNLCTNSVHAMRGRNGILEISLRETELDEDSVAAYQGLQPGKYVRLSVSDTGHGIDSTVLPRIFEPYFTTKKQGEGTGMGLAVIHGIVKNCGGDIKVYSEPGKGTTFHIVFPLLQSDAEIPIGFQKKTPTAGGSEHILLVDDEELLVEVGRQMLEKLGYRVSVFSSSTDAWEHFVRRFDAFDLVISDLIMPDLSGVQLIQRIKGIRPDMPVILCTGFSETISAAQVRELGVDALLLKPVDKNSIADAVRNALDVRKR